MSASQVQHTPIYNPDEMINNKIGIKLIEWESHAPGNGLAEINRVFLISPNFREALRNVINLYRVET